MKRGLDWDLNDVMQDSIPTRKINSHIKHVRIADKLFIEIEIYFMDETTMKTVRRKQIAEFDIKEVPE